MNDNTSQTRGLASDQKYSNTCPQTPPQEPSSQKSDKLQPPQQQQYNQQDVTTYIEHLKRGYFERLEQYQIMISDTCIQLEGDEMINAVKDDREMEAFRVKRFQEIVGEQIKFEQEMQIDKLIEQNAMLHLNVKRAEEQRDNLKSEVAAITERVLEFEGRVQSELAQRDILKAELETFQRNENVDRENYERLLKIREQSHQQSDALYKNELQSSRVEIEDLRKEKTELVLENEHLKEQTNVLANNIEILLLKLQSRQENDRSAESRTEELKQQIAKLSQLVNEYTKQKESLKEQISQQVSEIQALKTSLDEVTKENDFLASDTENLKIKVAKSETQVQEKTAEILAKLDKVKLKKKNLKLSFESSKLKLEGVSREIDAQRKLASESSDEYERIIAKMKSDMLTIRNEWEKRCITIEQASSAQLQEVKTKNEATIHRIQAEYQHLLEKKVNEMEEQMKQMELAQSKGIPAQRLERDYISKSMHAQILEEEIEVLQQRHTDTLGQIAERHHNNILDKIREISERKTKEFEIISQSLQANCLDLQNALSEQTRITAEQKEKLLDAENNLYKFKDINHQNLAEIKELHLQIEEKTKLNYEIEKHASSLQEHIGKIEQQNNSQQHSIKGQGNTLQNMQQLIDQLKDELHEQQTQVYELKEELARTEQQMEEHVEQNQSLNRQLESLRMKYSSEKDQALRTVQFQETLKLDKEREDHEETKRKFEKKQRALEKDISTLKEESEESIGELKERVNRVTAQKERAESEKKQLQEDFHQLQVAFDKMKRESIRLIKRLTLQLTSLGKDVDELKNDVATEVQTLHSAFQQTVKYLLAYVKEVKDREEIEINSRIHSEKRNVVDQYNAQVEQIEEQYQEQISKLQSQVVELTQRVESVQQELKSEQKSVASLEKQNAKLDSIIIKNSEDMQNHNKDLCNEINRIKEESNNLLQLSVESANAAAKTEIDALTKQIKMYEETLTQAKIEISKGQTLYERISKDLEITNEEHEKKDIMIEKLRDQLTEMSGAYENMQEENNQAFEILENKLAEYKSAITSEAEKYRIVKESSHLEIKQLHEEMNMLRHHLSLKGSSMDTIAKYHELTAYSKQIHSSNQQNAVSPVNQSAPSFITGFQQTARHQQPQIHPPIGSVLPRTLKHNSSHSNIGQAVVINSTREKSQAKKPASTLDKSFDIQKLDTLTEISRQHKMKAQQILSPTSGIAQQPTQDNKHDSPGILYEIKHLLAQSYELVNKSGTNSSATGVENQKKSSYQSGYRSSTTAAEFDPDEEYVRSTKNSHLTFPRAPRPNKISDKSPRYLFDTHDSRPETEKARPRFGSFNHSDVSFKP